jgi:hypothetical protein
VKKAARDEPIFFVHIKFNSVAGHNTAEKTKKTVDAFWAVVGKTLCMPAEKLLVHRLNIDGPAYERQIAVSTQTFALTFTEHKILEVNAQ